MARAPSPAKRGPADRAAQSDRRQIPWLPARASRLSGWALLPLRAFLGVTFCVAGLQKLANPNFFKRSDPSGIYAQMLAAERLSPLHFLLEHLLRVATPVGLVIAFGELAVGIGVLLGLFTRVAAVGGALISLSLFLTVSYSTSPYYTGADIVFFFAWLPLVIAGSGGVLSLDSLITARARRERNMGPATPVVVPFALVQEICGQYDKGKCRALSRAPCEPGPCPFLRNAADPGPPGQAGDLSRRQVVLGGTAAAAAGLAGLAIGGVAAGLGRAVGGAKPPPTTVSLSPTKPTSSPSTTSGPSAPTTRPAPPGTAIGPAQAVPPGSSAAFADPKTRDPSLVIHLNSGQFVAYDAICPHEGCTVGYVPTQDVIACPCHGSEFNPTDGHVLQGPAPHGLTSLTIAEGSDGQLYVKG